MSTLAIPVAAMGQEEIAKPASRLTLKSELDDMASLWPWVEALAIEYSIPDDTNFNVHLCLEEAVSNVIRHGYNGQPGHALTVGFASPRANEIVFTIEDEAPPFNPVSSAIAEDQPATSPMDYLRPGGRGILLLRKFAGTLGYERLAGGNRLTIGFEIPR